MNIGNATIIIGCGKRGTLSAALSDKNLHRNTSYKYFGKNVQRGSLEVCLRGKWRTADFECRNGWIERIEVE